MTKQEFQDKMQECRESRNIPHSVCSTLTRIYGHGSLRKLFAKLFSPSYDLGYWLDNCKPHNFNDNLTEKERRLLFLDMFEGYILVHELYKKY